MSARVLIADGNSERCERVAEACASLGLACDIVGNGAAALEAALAGAPAALVMQLDLALIDGPKLGSILRSNPRTRDMGLVYLGDPGSTARTGALVGELIDDPVDPQAVAEAVKRHVDARAPAGEAGEDEGDAEIGGVQGQLSQLALADLLELFHVSGKSGTVDLVRRDGSRSETGCVVLDRGEVVHAVAGPAEGAKALYRLLGWERGLFTYRPHPVAIQATIRTPTRALLREGLRQLREWERLAVGLPPLNDHVRLKVARSALPNVIHPLTQEVLVILEHFTRVSDILDHCSFPDYQVLRTLHTLIGRSLVEFRQDDTAVDLVPVAGLFNAAQVGRIHDWLDVQRPRGGVCGDAKLLLVASDAEALAGFLRCLARLPGVALDADAASATRDLVRVARIAMDDEVGIELFHVPAADRMAPLWPLAGHGAIGTLLLLRGDLGPAVAAVSRAADVLGHLPQARIFHLLLAETSEPLPPDEVRENLSLVDETSLFLIPLEDREKSELQLREMLGRMLP